MVTLLSEALASCVDGVPIDRRTIRLCLEDSNDVDWGYIYGLSFDAFFSSVIDEPNPRTFIVGMATVCFVHSATFRGFSTVVTAEQFAMMFVCHNKSIGESGTNRSLLRRVFAERYRVEIA